MGIMKCKDIWDEVDKMPKRDYKLDYYDWIDLLEQTQTKGELNDGKRCEQSNRVHLQMESKDTRIHANRNEGDDQRDDRGSAASP